MWREIGSANRAKTRFEVFTMPRDAAREQWDGYRWGPERAKTLLGADAAYTIDKLRAQILQWLERTPKGQTPRIFTNASTERENQIYLDRTLEEFDPRGRRGAHPLESISNVNTWTQALRRVKDAEELKVLRESARINVAGHLKLMQELRPGMRENEVRAILEGEYLKQGALDVAYSTIAAAGGNATILHYRAAREVCKKGDLLLVDAGCEYKGYASDITRTLPIGGKYSREQRLIMDLVMEAHQEAMLQVRVGRPYTGIHKAASKCLKEGLQKLKLLKKGVEYTRYYPHGTGHWLGLDVHDPCFYHEDDGESVKLEAGMVMTIEPGLYFMPDDKTAPSAFRGIGVRIEDDVVVSKSGAPENLTQALPRTADEVEDAMSK